MESVTKVYNDAMGWCRHYIPTLVWKSKDEDVAALVKKTVESETHALQLAAQKSGGLPPDFSNLVRNGSPFVRIAGLSGAAAVALGAYGAHAFIDSKPEMKKVYDTANFYHFVHTLALLAVPMTRRPMLSGILMITGTTIFCGTIYYHALTEEKHLRKFTPYGGIILMLAWVSMVL